VNWTGCAVVDATEIRLSVGKSSERNKATETSVHELKSFCEASFTTYNALMKNWECTPMQCREQMAIVTAF
jgi:hypothetical protein